MIKVYFESKNHAELAATFTNEDTYLACLPALENTAKKSNMKVTESCDLNEITEAKKTLKENNCFIGQIWTFSEIAEKYKCTEKEAEKILNDAFDSEYLAGEINWSLDDSAEKIIKNKQ